jgi:putative spermidine/putrescine transport system ATP-binding protein
MDVKVRDLTCRFGAFLAVDNVSFNVPAGECLALLGPSGCGKTTTLNMVAGFIKPMSGDIRVGGTSVIGVSPHHRNTGFVFQNYALFPHFTVFENVAYGLRQRKVPENRIKTEVHKALEMVRLTGLQDRFPRELSGGQQQRVSLARALVFEPDILLLDEPLSNLDAKLRDQMRLELQEIRQRTGVTTILVTHDQTEAMTIAEKIAVMNKGRIEQIGSAEEIYSQPATRFVADFVGVANFLRGRVANEDANYLQVRLSSGDRIVRVQRGESTASCGEEVELLVRPEHLRITSRATNAENELPVRVRTVLFSGPYIDCFAETGDISLNARMTATNERLQPDHEAFASWDPDFACALRSV